MKSRKFRFDSTWMMVSLVVFALAVSGRAAAEELPWRAEGTVQPELLELVNQARGEARDCGDESFEAAAPLEWNEDLAKAALDHSNDMATHRLRGHEGSDGSRLRDRVSRHNPAMGALGEAIQLGGSTAERAVNMLLRSPPHCAILMGARFTGLGGSLSYNDTNYPYWVLVVGRVPEEREVERVQGVTREGPRSGQNPESVRSREEEDPIAVLRENGVRFVFQAGAGFGMNESRAAGVNGSGAESFRRHRFTLGLQVLGSMNPENPSSTADLGLFGDFGFMSGRGVRDFFPSVPVMYDEEYQSFWNLEVGSVFLKNLPLIALRLSGGAGMQGIPTSLSDELLITATGGVVMSPGGLEFLHVEGLARGYWSGLTSVGWELSGRVGVVWGF